MAKKELPEASEVMPKSEMAESSEPTEEAETAELLEPAEEQNDEPENVTVTVPHNYNLRLDHDTIIHFKAGVQEMKREHAEHTYSKAHGVKIYTKGS